MEMLLKALKRAGKTQKELANAIPAYDKKTHKIKLDKNGNIITISESEISHIMAGRRYVGKDLMERMGEYLGMTDTEKAIAQKQILVKQLQMRIKKLGDEITELENNRR
jgi:transcriptional regulator with XRE-family HTH domain